MSPSRLVVALGAGIRLDGVRTGNGKDGLVYELFDPPWWRVDRWVNWLFLFPRRARTRINVLFDSGPRRLRARAVTP